MKLSLIIEPLLGKKDTVRLASASRMSEKPSLIFKGKQNIIARKLLRKSFARSYRSMELNTMSGMCGDNFNRPYGTRLIFFTLFPAINRWAIFKRP